MRIMFLLSLRSLGLYGFQPDVCEDFSSLAVQERNGKNMQASVGLRVEVTGLRRRRNVEKKH